ncbi:ATP-binding protein [Gordonia sp. (in: high G+C Gram-positive bacteria)]|uniref:ATP-binding protein n=1 Tax=Gordonia sp. (in: high G+C Gram-positive bacteria) TaxID=84139 RepID=UPI002634B4D9|nr:ATP-binding protein [Gordonia sp. (in: high G+C Gram-positive bacteria)]HMS74359.1 ATP-binding protein [Gordonia sp. (in: high G+C Gram-positive bacteria)]HQV16872.1 ATP-binding protein [Gordonia sp. (in: high G+C Gram-positive bacteria)]
MGTLGTRLELAPPRDPEYPPRDPEYKGMVERNNGFFETSFLPGHRFESPADFNTQISSWLTEHSNRRNARAIGRCPSDLLAADVAAMAALPTVPPRVGIHERRRLARDYCVPVAGNDYSVHPAAIGRFVDITATLDLYGVTFTPHNVILLGPPGVGKAHLAIALGIKATHNSYPVLFDTATGWATRLTKAHATGRLQHELKRLRRYRLLIVDEIGYLPFDSDTANLFFQLIASRYEQGSILITSNMPFGRWGKVFADEIVAAALIDRLVHHAEVITITGDSYRTKNRRDLAKHNQ